MHDLDWIDNEPARSGALQATGVPASWLGRLGVAVIEAEGLIWAATALDPFRRTPWSAAADPLAALGRVVGTPADPLPLDEQPPGELVGGPGNPSRRRPSAHAPFIAGPPGARHSFPAAQESAAPRSPTLPGRPSRDDLSAAAIRSPQAHPALPEVAGTPISAQQLARLASGQQLTGAGTHRPSATGNPHRGTSGAKGQSHAPMEANSPTSARSPGSVGSERPPNSPSLPATIAHPAATAGLPGSASTAGNAQAQPPAPGPPSVALPPAGAALLARLTEPPAASADGETAADFPDLARRAIAQAFRAIVQPVTLPASRLTALAALVSRPRSGPDQGHTARGPGQSNRPPVRPPATGSIGEPGAETGAAPVGPSGLALLRDSVAAFDGASAPGVAAQPVARAPQPTGAGSIESLAEHPGPPDLLAPGSPNQASGLPVVQNTFNVTLHMAGGLEHGEEELAERLTRILMDQARRYGIDI